MFEVIYILQVGDFCQFIRDDRILTNQSQANVHSNSSECDKISIFKQT